MHGRSSALVIAVLSMLTVVAPAMAGDWPQFLGPDRNNVSTEKGLADTFPADGPKMFWSAKIGPGFGGVAVQDGKAYMLDRDGLKGDILRCWDAATGKEEWTFAYDAPGQVQYPGSRSTPAIDDKYVFIVSPFGLFQCVDKKTHAAVWKTHLLKDFGGGLPMWAVSQSPLLYKDAVIVAPRGTEAGVVAFEKATGKTLWKSKPLADGKSQMCYDSPMLATIGGVEMIVSMAAIPNANPRAMPNKCIVVGLDPKDGSVLWSYKGWGKAWPIPGPVDLGEGKILLSGEYGAGLTLIQIAKGEKGEYGVKELFDLSKKTTMASQIHQPLLVGDHVYFVSNGFDRADGLVCMDLAGEVKWRTGKKPNFDLGGSILADGKLFLLDGKTGELRVVRPDPKEYKELAVATVLDKPQMWGPITISDGRLFVRDQQTLKCLDVRASGATTAPAK